MSGYNIKDAVAFIHDMTQDSQEVIDCVLDALDAYRDRLRIQPQKVDENPKDESGQNLTRPRIVDPVQEQNAIMQRTGCTADVVERIMKSYRNYLESVGVHEESEEGWRKAGRYRSEEDDANDQ